MSTSSSENAATLWERWSANAERWPERDAIVHVVAGEPPRRWRWRDLIEAARRFGARLAAEGVRPGDVLAIVVRHHPDFYPLYLGAVSIGAVPAVLAYPNPRLHPDKFRRGLSGMAQRSGLQWLASEADLHAVLEPLTGTPQSTVKRILLPFEQGAPIEHAPADPIHAAPEAVCLVQHSSGTTGLQKGVALTHRAVLRHVDDYADAIEVVPDDVIVSWLPLYHDMGLIAALHLSLARAIPLVQLDPFEWVIAPELFLQYLSSERGTLGWLPNFAYNLMAARAREHELEGTRLDRVRLLVNCSEPLRADSHEKFYTRFASLGLRRTALGGSYAMAETTFAVTQTPPGAPARTLTVSRDALLRGSARPAADGESTRTCVSSGRPLPGCEVRAVAEDGSTLPPNGVGELLVRSPALFDGYLGAPELTALAVENEWYRTGDIGFIDDGEVFVVGRKKDLIIIAGKNLAPEDIEDAVNDVPGVIPGRVVAFGDENPALGTEEVCVIVETTLDDEASRRALKRAIVEAVMRIDVTVARVYVAPPRWLIKSSSGKPSRGDNRQRVLDELTPT